MNHYEYDIIVFSLFRDDSAYSSVSLSLAKEWAKNNRVFYINHPYSLKDWWEKRHEPHLQKRKIGFRKAQVQFEECPTMPNIICVTPPPTLPINFLPDGTIYNLFNRFNNRAVTIALRETIKKYNIKKYIFYNCYDPFFLTELPKNLEVPPSVTVYHCIDDLDHEAYTAKHGMRLEKELVQQYDICLATATQLRKKYLDVQPDAQILTNAVDISIFRKVLEQTFERPAELKNIRTKIIGFTGNLDHLRIDYQLFKKIALAHPDKTLVIVGPINSQEFYDIGLDKMPNVVFTGGKKIEELPQYVHFFDVAIIPFKLNGVTRSIYPLKINEYLGAGRTVVSTKFSEDIQFFRDVIYLAEDENDFIQKINQAIEEDSDDKIIQRVNVASRNTWTDRVEQFWDIVENYLQKQAFSEKKALAEIH